MPNTDVLTKLKNALNLIEKQIRLNRDYFSIRDGSPGCKDWDIWVLFYEPLNGPIRRDLQFLINNYNSKQPVEEYLPMIKGSYPLIKRILDTPDEKLNEMLSTALKWQEDLKDRNRNRASWKVNRMDEFLELTLGKDPERDREIYDWLSEYLPKLDEMMFDKEEINQEAIQKLAKIRQRLNELHERFEEHDDY